MVTARRGASQIALAVATVSVLHLVCWQASAPLRRQSARLTVSTPSLARRNYIQPVSIPAYAAGNNNNPKYHAVLFDEDDPSHEEIGSIFDYSAAWEKATPKQRPFVFAAFVLWLTFLFAFVGITASDFFCPNLSTIASRLGLSESVAGVTFLAFSNGSPDVFSTFAALRSNSGSLAIGELLGAASFITSVVAGTMCVIQPFRVARHSFMRDVGFFTVAVAFTLGILWDSHIHAWEAAAMVGLYVIYVFVVAIGSWWHARKERKAEILRQARSQYAVEEDVEPYRDDPSDLLQPGRAAPLSPMHTPRRSRSHSPLSTPGLASPSEYPFPSPMEEYSHHHIHSPMHEEALNSLSDRGTAASAALTRSRSNTTTHTHRRAKSRPAIRPSLLGAIEFRDVVNSLKADSGAKGLHLFGPPDEDDLENAKLYGRSRAHSHLGVQRPPLEGTRTPSAISTEDGQRRVTWTGEPGPLSAPSRERCQEDHGHWGESDSEDGEGSALGQHTPLIDLTAGAENPWAQAVGKHPPLSLDIPSTAATNRDVRRRASASSLNSQKVPSIRLTTDEGEETTIVAPGFFTLRHRRWYQITRAVVLSLFPSLQDFRSKSIVGKATALLCVPAILALNLTLPVVEIEEDECASCEEVKAAPQDDESGEITPRQGLLIDTSDPALADSTSARFQREAVAHQLHSHVVPNVEVEGATPWTGPLDAAALEQRLAPLSLSESEVTAMPDSPQKMSSNDKTPVYATTPTVQEHLLTRWLTAVQCVLGPLFCTFALLYDELRWWYPIVALAFGFGLAIFTFWCFKDPRHPGRIILCFLGFFVAMVWILMIVNEVVGVLLTFGEIFGLSHAILGLTIFAMGNSLGDLVANATVARMGFPSMAIAACFGGPMLNILLGVGLSGAYLIIGNGGIPLQVDMSRTLLVSGIGLLVVLISTLIVVPMNHFWMSKRLGISLIAAYMVILSINIAVEVWWS